MLILNNILLLLHKTLPGSPAFAGPQPWPQPPGCDLWSTAPSCSYNQKAAKVKGPQTSTSCAPGNAFWVVYGKLPGLAGVFNSYQDTYLRAR